MKKRKLFCKIHSIEKKQIGKKRIFYKCLECERIKLKIWRENNKEKVQGQNKKYRERMKFWLKKDRENDPEKYRNYSLKGYSLNKRRYVQQSICRRYKLTFEQYELMFKLQNNLCAICNNPETRKPKNAKNTYNLSVDHCHKTKKVRGLLCYNCNILLGKAQDNIALLQKAIQYLKEHEAQ